MSCSDNTYRIYCYTHLAAFQLYSWRDQVNMQLTNRVGKTLAHVSFYGLKLKLWQEEEDIMNKVGQICLATVHQRQLLTNVCSLAEAANDLSRVMHMQFVIHEALIYVPSYSCVFDSPRTTIRRSYTAQRRTYDPLTILRCQITHKISSSHIIRNCVNLIYCKVVVEGNSLKKRQEWNIC